MYMCIYVYMYIQITKNTTKTFAPTYFESYSITVEWEDDIKAILYILVLVIKKKMTSKLKIKSYSEVH